ncbi:hypothetical protein NQ318_014583 [Aromia moschata]|uniref:Uncharacterized protein n=1 Tax=Aromia moschata TaxID=1265417 RepID=A0AAV8Y0A2_9CUCU|nr:hypothetical protein NQ318_014583 [Aromia moschata]
MISEQLNLPKTIVHEIVSEDLALRKICAKLVPKVLTDAQKEHRVEVWKELKELCTDDPSFLDNVITGDGSWYAPIYRTGLYSSSKNYPEAVLKLEVAVMYWNTLDRRYRSTTYPQDPED